MQNKLGEFIRVHRERIGPEAVGLPVGGRRRTPGLRREELAQLCGVSPTWLTWLEQGRPVSASGKVLHKLAQAMQLSTAERAYLFKLSDKRDPTLESDSADPLLCDDPGDSLATIVDAIAVPAYILNRHWDAVAWNTHATSLFAGWLDSEGVKNTCRPAAGRPNQLRFMFCSAASRTLIVDWPDRAARLVAEFRAECGKYADQPPLAGPIRDLMRDSDDFRRLWTSQNVVDREGGARAFRHPSLGALTCDQVNFQLAKRHDLKLVMLLPV